MRLRPLALTLITLCAAATPCAAQALSPAAQLEMDRLQRQAAQYSRQTVNPAFCQQEKQKAAQWRMRATTLASPWKENLLASADKQDAAAAQCLQRGTGSKTDADYSQAQADRLKNHQPLLLPQRSQAVTDKYNRTRKNLQELIDAMRDSLQRMQAGEPRLRALVGKKWAQGPSKNNPPDGIFTVSQENINSALGPLVQVRFMMASAQERYERLNFKFADKFTTDFYLEEPRFVVFDISNPYSDALEITEYEWVMLGNETAWQLRMAQLAANQWAGPQAAAALAAGDAFELEKGKLLDAANANPGKPNAVLGNRTGPENLLKFEAATQPGIDVYCNRFQKAAAGEVLALAPQAQAAASQLTARRNLLMQLRKRLAVVLAYPKDLNANGRTPLNYPSRDNFVGHTLTWPPGLALDVAVPGKGHPTYYVSTRIGFIACPDWRDQMPKDLAARFPAVTADFTEAGVADLNLNLINPLVLEGEAEGRAPEQQL